MDEPKTVFELRVAITARNYQSAKRFYHDILGLPLVSE